MIQSYFEDMQQVLSDLLMKAKNEGELWLIVTNSVYVETEIPVDLILAEIGTRVGWKLKRIEVLRYIYRRKTKYCGNIDKVRESLIVFQKS
jgi:prefoldin subunit 5